MLQLQLAAKQHLAVVQHVVAAAVQHVAPALDVQAGLAGQLHQLLHQQQLQLPLMHLHLQLKQHLLLQLHLLHLHQL